MDRQGNDVGSSYRSEIFYTSDDQREVAEETIADVDASGLWPGKVVTEVSEAGPFWEAEPSTRTTYSGSRTATPATSCVRTGSCRTARRPRRAASWSRPRLVRKVLQAPDGRPALSSS